MITDSGHKDASDVYIVASGDRDFNDVLNTLAQRNLNVIVWGVRGSTSRLLEKNAGLELYALGEFILIVAGILVAMEINNWNESRKEEHLAAQYIRDIYSD